MARKTIDSRPKIWAEGKQHPKLDPRSFALASVGFAREGLSGVLERCSASVRSPEGADAPVNAAEGRMARIARVTGTLLDQAACWVGGQDAPRTESIFSANPEAPPKPEPVANPAPAHAMALDPDLALLRSVIADARTGGTDGARPTRAERKAEKTAVAEDRRAGRRRVLARAAGTVLGFGLLVVSVPYGMARAIWAHMNGQDLRRDA